MHMFIRPPPFGSPKPITSPKRVGSPQSMPMGSLKPIDEPATSGADVRLAASRGVRAHSQSRAEQAEQAARAVFPKPELVRPTASNAASDGTAAGAAAAEDADA